MPLAVLAVLIFAALPARGEDPAGPVLSTTAAPDGGRRVRYPFGEIVLPVPISSGKEALSRPVGKPRAENRGVFRLSYRLERDGAAVFASSVAVRVANRQVYHEAPDRRLREHEAVHERINRSAAARIERELSGFRMEGATYAQAEKALKARFREALAAVRRAHDDWDQTDVFPAPGGP